MSQRRMLAPLVGAGMAAVAAGSLVLFSLLAQEAALSPPAGEVVTPRVPAGGPPSEVTVPASGDGSELGFELAPAAAFLVGEPPSAVDEAPETGGETTAGDALVSVLAVKMKLATTLDFEGPTVGVGSRKRTGGDPADPPADDCPGRPDKDRARGEHPHGGPPACGNPHGAPPGYGKNDPEDPGSPGSSGEREPGGSGGSGKESGGQDHPHGGPPGRESTPPKSPPGPPDDGGADGDGADPQGPSEHPHGGPPGQDKGDGSTGSGNPHGAPPGQTKKDK